MLCMLLVVVMLYRYTIAVSCRLIGLQVVRGLVLGLAGRAGLAGSIGLAGCVLGLHGLSGHEKRSCLMFDMICFDSLLFTISCE